MRFETYLHFDGDCREAFDFYAAATGGTLGPVNLWGGSPAEAMGGEAMKDKVLHVWLELGGSRLLGSDVPPAHVRPPQGFAVVVQAETAEEADRVFEALAEGGTVTMPLGETFWAKRYGMLTDRFGVNWMVNLD